MNCENTVNVAKVVSGHLILEIYMVLLREIDHKCVVTIERRNLLVHC